MATPGVPGAPGPRILGTSILPTPHPWGGSAGLSPGRREAKLFANKRSLPSSGMCMQGPGKEGTLGPARDKREGHRCGRQPGLQEHGHAGTQARARASRHRGA